MEKPTKAEMQKTAKLLNNRVHETLTKFNAVVMQTDAGKLIADYAAAVILANALANTMSSEQKEVAAAILKKANITVVKVPYGSTTKAN